MNSAMLLVAFLQSIYKLTETSHIQLIETLDENGHRQLTCLFAMNKEHSIDSVSMFANSLTNDTFCSITLFKPGKSAYFSSPNGDYLSKRASLTNITESSKEATIKFSNILCEDEREYYCKILYTSKSKTQHEMISNIYNLFVKVVPTKPDKIFPLDPQSVVEGNNVKFTCEGNIGKPAGKYLWQKVRNDTTIFLYENVSTAVTQVSHSESCGTNNGSSNLTLNMAAEDNRAIVRCVEQSLNGSEHMYAQSPPVNVLYKVRNTRITKHPNEDFYLVGSNPITLICNADGNPPCTYTWYKANNRKCVLSKEPSLVIIPVKITSNGTYLCEAVNEFNGNVHKQNQIVSIYIKSTQNIFIWIVMGLLVVLVTVALLAVFYCKQKRDSSLQSIDINMHYDSTMAQTIHTYDAVDNTTNNSLYDEIK